eukprot:3236050-Pyramimonas_sp.AAC.1
MGQINERPVYLGCLVHYMSYQRGSEGKYWSSLDAECSLRTRLIVKNIRGIFKVCCTSFEQGNAQGPQL